MKSKSLVVLFLVVSITAFASMSMSTSTAAPGVAWADQAPVPPSEINAPTAPSDVPDTLVAEGVTSYDLAAPKLFWYTWSQCIPPVPRAPTADYAESISRIATYGGITRTLYYEEVAYPGCQDDVLSNIVADDSYVYWMSYGNGGVVRLSTSANIGDPPELLSSAISGNAELAQDSDYIYALSKTGGGIRRISKTDGTSLNLVTDPGSSPHNLQADGKYVYWITTGSLKRISRSGGLVFISTIATGVSGYYAEGRKMTHCIIGDQCYYTEYVFVGQSSQVVRYNNLTGDTSAPIYTSTDTTASVYSLVSDFHGLWSSSSYLFLLESREVSCPPGEFCTYQDVLVRTGWGGGTAESLYVATGGLPGTSVIADHIKTDGTLLFWDELGALKRLPNDADALPQINLDVSSLEVTQGIQDIYNSVRLIQDRRTFVRVYADSDGDPVPGVTAYLYRTNGANQVLDGPLVPVNPVGQQITVPSWSNRTKLNDSFLFELPWDWTASTLYLRAEINPNKYPLEPNYEDNELFDGPFTFQTSPRLQVQFVSFGYVLNDQVYYPRLIDDVFQTYSWIRRAYPLASTPGSASDPSPGFRPNLWIMADDELGSRVDQSAPECAELYPDPDLRNLCASAYTNSLLRALRLENNIPANVFMYGMISDAAGHFPRGQAGGGNVSSGPAGGGTWGWDFDGSYADWYAGHEIGHTLGRAHPAVNADDPSTKDVHEGCGHSPDDPNYPYAFALISNGPAMGFDGGDPGLNPKLQMTVYPGIFWYDVMSYCPNQWISDYTYDAMYDYMAAHPTSNLNARSPTDPQINGDFLSIVGTVAPDSDVAVIHRVRRLSSVASIPPLLAGDADYRIRLLGAGDAILTDYPFIPATVYNSDEPTLNFGQVVTFTAGTVQVQIVKGAADQVLASQSLSANPPTISDVALQGVSEPVSGTVTLTWTASDPDIGSLRLDNGLSFDILYSADGGTSFQPVQVGVSGSSAQIDTASLGGSTNAILRVIACDGVHTAQDDTGPFTMANKPPEPRILSPADGTHIHYGQLLNFSGEALDLQDGSVASSNLVWSNQYGQLGTGPLLSIDDLPVGVNQIKLSATNSVGLSADTSINVTVDDDLDWPGPTLSVGPAQVAWHVSAGETQAQTADLSISNAGTGDLTWMASEDAPWLTISAISGTVPYTLTLTADPSGLSDGTVQNTTLLITSPESTDHLTETVAIPVTLSVGDVYRPGPVVPDHWVYLPVVLRNK